MEKVREYLKEFGFLDKDINNILTTYPVNHLLEDTLLNHCIENNNFFLEKGYSKAEIIKMVKNQPFLYASSKDNLSQKIKDIISLGYTQSEVIKMTKSQPALYSLDIEENIEQKIDDLIALGYTKEEIIKMTKVFPALFSYSKKNIERKIDDLVALGYTKEEVINMTVQLPTLYGSSIEKIKEKILYLKEIELDFVVLNDTKQLMQSLELTYARYQFLKEEDIIISIDSYKLLFRSNKRFTSQFNITKEELLKKYQYKNKEERRR